MITVFFLSNRKNQDRAPPFFAADYLHTPGLFCWSLWLLEAKVVPNAGQLLKKHKGLQQSKKNQRKFCTLILIPKSTRQYQLQTSTLTVTTPTH